MYRKDYLNVDLSKLVTLVGTVFIAGALFIFSGCGGSPQHLLEDASPLQYMEYMYDDANGRDLYNRSCFGVFYTRCSDAGGETECEQFSTRLYEYLQVQLIEDVCGIVSPDATYWWERCDVNAENLSTYLNTDEGKQAIDEYITEQLDAADSFLYSQGNQMFTPCVIPWPAIGATAGIISGLFGIANGINMSCTLDNIEDSQMEILEKIDEIDRKLDALQQLLKEQVINELQNIENMLLEEEYRDCRDGIEDAEQYIIGHYRELVAIKNLDNEKYRSRVEDFITTGYETNYISAFESFEDTVNFIATYPEEDEEEKPPFDMFLSDVVFLRRISEMRLSLAPVVFSGQELLQWRTQMASYDLQRVEKIRDYAITHYDESIEMDYAIELWTLIASWDITLLSHFELGGGVVNVYCEQLQDAANVTHGFGTFGKKSENPPYGHILRNSDGYFLCDLTALEYEQPVPDIFDSNVSGELSSKTCLRIVENGENITDNDGWTLTPVLKAWPNNCLSPPGNQLYIDPVFGQFVLPRPVYWSRMEKNENITSDAEISMRQPGFIPTLDVVVTNKNEAALHEFGEELYTQGKFGSCLGTKFWIYVNSDYKYHYPKVNQWLYPFGENMMNWNTGAVSVWLKRNIVLGILDEEGYIDGISTFDVEIMHKLRVRLELFEWVNESHTTPVVQSTVRTYISENEVSAKQITLSQNEWIHLFVVWNQLESRVDIIMDQNSIDVVEDDIPDLSSDMLRIRNYSSAQGNLISGGVLTSTVESYVDNLKIWRDAETGGRGLIQLLFGMYYSEYEDALHWNYSADNNFMPLLTGEGNGVGYYYIP